MQSVFISGIRKKTGKSLVCAGIAGTMQGLSYSVSYYKPIQTNAKIVNGIIQSQDLNLVKYVDSNIKGASTYAFPSSLSPIVSAYESHSKINLGQIYDDFQLNAQMREFHIVEGANSISNPIDEQHTEVDLIKKLSINLVVVINPKMSTIDEAISHLMFVKNNKLKCNGIILTDYEMDSDNLEEKYYPQLIKRFTGYDTIGVIPHYENIRALNPETLIADTIGNINLEKVFNAKIPKLSMNKFSN